MKVVLIGGNPKGHRIPFSSKTFSGRRLHKIIKKAGLTCEIVDMTSNSNDVCSDEEKELLRKRFENCQVVFLGRFVERQLRDVFPNGVYLPHPASRRKKDLERLEEGLKKLKNMKEESEVE